MRQEKLLEEWLPIGGFANYEVSNRGRVRRRFESRNRQSVPMRKLTKTPYGYLVVCMRDNSRELRNPRVHRLVLFAFRGPPPSPHHQCAHLDGSRDNNRLENLRWVTPEENQRQRWKHGTMDTRLTEKQVSAIRFMSRGMSIREIAAVMPVGKTTVWEIVSRRSWKHLP